MFNRMKSAKRKPIVDLKFVIPYFDEETEKVLFIDTIHLKYIDESRLPNGFVERGRKTAMRDFWDVHFG